MDFQLYLLLMLNCGFTNIDVGTLLKSEVRLKEGASSGNAPRRGGTSIRRWSTTSCGRGPPDYCDRRSVPIRSWP